MPIGNQRGPGQPTKSAGTSIVRLEPCQTCCADVEQEDEGIAAYRVRSASTPGRALPSIHSRKAPPAVET